MRDDSLLRRRSDSAAVAGDHLVLHRPDGRPARIALVVDRLDDGVGLALVEDLLQAFPYAELYTLADERARAGHPIHGRRATVLAGATTDRGRFGLFRRRQSLAPPRLPAGHDVVLRVGDRRARTVRADHDCLDLVYVLALDEGADERLGDSLRDRTALRSVDVVWCGSRRLMAALRRRWRVEATLLYPAAEPAVPLAFARPDRRVLAVVDGASPNWLHRLEAVARLRPDLQIMVHGAPARVGRSRRSRLVPIAPGAAGFLDHIEGCITVVMPPHDAFDARAVWAQSAGVPVLTPTASASAEVVLGLDQRVPTGIVLEEASAEALADAVTFIERNPALFAPEPMAAHALRWSRPRFRRTVKSLVLEAWCQHLAGSAQLAAERPATAPADAPADALDA